MKKNLKELEQFNLNPTTNKNPEQDKYKTTNVNILLNRVRLNEKRTLQKRIIFSLILTFFMSLIVVFFII